MAHSYYDAARNPRASGFQVLVFNGGVTDQNVQKLVNNIAAAHEQGFKGVWVNVHSGGGAPGGARYVYEFLRSINYPAIAHACDAFSEGSSLVAAFPYRTISPVGKIGFHQANMNVTGGDYGEARLSDLLQQLRGHNRAMVEHLALSLNLPIDRVRPWVFDGSVFVGDDAVAAGIVHEVLTPYHPEPGKHIILNL